MNTESKSGAVGGVRVGRWPLVLVVLCAVAGAPAFAQELFVVTSTTDREAVTLEIDEAEAQFLSLGSTVFPGVLRVSAGQRVMMFADTGVVAVLVGPAELAVTLDDLTGGVAIELRDGSLMLEAAGVDEFEIGTTLLIPMDDLPDTENIVEVAAPPGRTFVRRGPDTLDLGFITSDGTATEILVGDDSVELESGKLLAISRDGEQTLGSLDQWSADTGFDQSPGRVLGVASAQAARSDIEAKLFRKIIAWDQYAGAKYVVARLREYRFNPEIRQTVQQISRSSRSSTRGGSAETQPFDAANQVPLLSPASLSVQNLRNVGEGVTAIQLNNAAAAVLEQTGSRGLGFRGLQQLAIPGTGAGGRRTVGPAGLGATP